jgi:succinoglycan biosynthesis transport protein ExoP
MNTLVSEKLASSSTSNNQIELEDMLSMKEMVAILLRHIRLIILCMAVGFIGSFIYIFFAQPRYAASTSILIDPRQQSMLPDLLGDQFMYKDAVIIDSQIEVIRSTKLLDKAAEKAGAYKNIAPQQPGFFSSVMGSVLGEDADAIKQDEQRLSEIRQRRFLGFKGGLRVSRMPGTYVIKIEYVSTDAKRAAKIANLVADVYLEDELEAQYEASERTGAWLKTRLSVLRNDLAKAEQEVEAFKEANDLVHAVGKSVSEQQLDELNASLSVARADSARAKARFDRVQEIIAKDDAGVAVSEMLNNRVVAGLHDKYIELSRLANEIRYKQGEEHQAYVNLQRQMKDIQRIIMEEYERIAESNKAEYEIAQARYQALQKEMDSVIDNSSGARRSQIQLRELERRAESMRNLYTKMLDNFNAQTERQSVPIVNARVISYAGTPLSPSWPNERYIMIIGLFLGGLLGVGFAFLREQFNRFLWKPEEIEHVTHRTCLGMLPKIAFDGAKLVKGPPDVKARQQKEFNRDGFGEVTQLLNKQTGVITEIMRNIQLAVQFRKSDGHAERKAKIISFVSARPGEGKSIASCFLAAHLAKSGAKVLLVDCDFRRPSLTNWFMPGAERGFYEVASRYGEEVSKQELDAALDEVRHETGDERLDFIPAKGCMTPINNLNLVASGQMHEVLQHLQTQYDAILIDLPPIINIVDARVVANTIDSFIFLAYWGKTDRDLVKKALHRAPEVFDRTVGALLTLVDTDKAGSYGYYNYNYYYQN